MKVTDSKEKTYKTAPGSEGEGSGFTACNPGAGSGGFLPMTDIKGL